MRFDITVFVGTAGVGLLGRTAVVIHQRRVTRRERGAIGVVANRSAERIGTMLSRHAAEVPKRILDPLAECLEGLRETQRDRLDIAVRQHTVKQRVLEGLSGDRHTE